MTKPQSDRANVGSNEREKESAAVRIETETTTGLNDRTDEKTALIESDTKALTSTEDSDDATDATSDDSETDTDSNAPERNPAQATRRISWSRLLAFGLLPGLALLMAVAAAYLRYQDGLASDSGTARIESVATAKESTIALLSYKPETADKELGAARDRLTGTFKESYTQLTHDVVIPGAKQKHISAVATVPAAASVSATPTHAVALVFINQTVVIGTDNPTDTASSVRVTLDKVAGRWLISGFDPV